jgi:regulator of protease activity HflC (stomatin/prohibitin superfamily)
VLSKINDFSEWLKRKIPVLIIFTLGLLVMALYFWPRIVVTIHSGEAGVKYWRFFGGTVVDYVYPEGIHFVFPWDKLYVYNIRIQTLLHDFEVLSSGGLHVELKLAIRFRPEKEVLGLLHQQVGPDYVNTIIISEIESVVREEISKLSPEQIYQFKVGKGSWISQVVVNALEKAGHKFVTIDDVIVRDIKLPEPLRQAIENKLVEEQKFATYTYKILAETQELKRKRIEAEGIKEYNRIISKNLDEKLIKWQGVQATMELAKSDNSKIIIIGAGKEGLPVILGTER